MITTDELTHPVLNHVSVPADRERVRFLEADPQVSGLKSQVSSAAITCLILTYNEESRLPNALAHALRWADEVVVVDKGSTDRTREIAASAGVRVHAIPFSRQGHETYEEMVAGATHDWVWGFTPGEVPTRRVIYAAKQLISEGIDLVRIPTKLWSFGVHDPRSPWGLGYQPRLYHRRRVTFTGIAHAPIKCLESRTAFVEAGPDCYVFHPTHATADAFIRSHADYAINEAAQDTPERMLNRALYHLQAHDHAFNSSPALLPQQLAWKHYWLGVALHAWERGSATTEAGDVPRQYRALTEQALAEWSA